MSGGEADGVLPETAAVRCGGSDDGAAVRERVLAAARGFIGTPYRHQGSRKGIGCDCLGLIRGIWRELYGEEPEDPGPYTPDWAERSPGEQLIEAAGRHLRPIAIGDALPGDVVLFRWRTGMTAKHCGVLDIGDAGDARNVGGVGGMGQGRPGSRLLHAYEGTAVVSSPMPMAWVRRIAAAFRFPE